MAKNYEKYMRRALELAANGWGWVNPNPMVGALIVKDDQIVSEGFHRKAGCDHAEIMAIDGADCPLNGSEMIVNLEPCSHFGSTPPCVDKIIDSGIKRVVYGMIDPNPMVSGEGLEKLSSAGVEVLGPVLEDESRSLNRIFINWIATERPYVISKVALSLDGKIALENGESKWITNEKCRHRMHYWRSGVDAVLIGADTLRIDNPRLDVRGLEGARQPRPIVITSTGKLKDDLNLWKHPLRPVIVCGDDATAETFSKKDADIICVKNKSGLFDWNIILRELGRLGITSILVEGGATVHSQLMEKQLVSYMITSISTRLVGSAGKEWLPGWKNGSVPESPMVKPDHILILDDNVVIEGEIDYREAG